MNKQNIPTKFVNTQAGLTDFFRNVVIQEVGDKPYPIISDWYKIK